MNKRGLELAISTIVVIVLSITVLVLLIVFLTTQTDFFSRYLIQDESNVDVVVRSCDGFVKSQSSYAYCCEKREVVFGGGKESLILTCDEIALESWSNNRVGFLDCSSQICE